MGLTNLIKLYEKRYPTRTNNFTETPQGVFCSHNAKGTHRTQLLCLPGSPETLVQIETYEEELIGIIIGDKVTYTI